MDTKDAGALGGRATHRKHPEHLKELARKRFEGMTKEDISNFMKRVSRTRFEGMSREQVSEYMRKTLVEPRLLRKKIRELQAKDQAKL